MSQINEKDTCNCDSDAYCKIGDETSSTMMNKTRGKSGPDKSGRGGASLFVHY